MHATSSEDRSRATFTQVLGVSVNWRQLPEQLVADFAIALRARCGLYSEASTAVMETVGYCRNRK